MIHDNIWFKDRQSEMGLTNKEMAKALGFSEKHVENMRNGRRSIAMHTTKLINLLREGGFV